MNRACVIDVPSYPAFMRGTDVLERRYYDQYLARFEKYATTVIRAQTVVVERMLTRTSVDSMDVRNVLREVRNSLAGSVEATATVVSAEVNAEVRKLSDLLVASKEELQEKVGERLEKVVVGCGSSGHAGESVRVDEVPVVSEKTLANRAKREKKKAAKLRKQATDCGNVPEWRRKDDDVSRRARLDAVRKELSQFAVCSEDVRKSLAESRAERFIAENRAAAVRAEKARRVEVAKLQTGEAERKEELARLKLTEQLEEQRKKDTSYVPGYAETVLSGSVPGLTSVASGDSVSPSDSISVADRERLEKAMRKLLLENDSLKAKVGLLQDRFEKIGKLREFKVFSDDVTPEQRQKDYLEAYDVFKGEEYVEPCEGCGLPTCECGVEDE